MKKSLGGFTIVEIIIVTAVIGILSTIGIVSFSKIQSDSRDAIRSSKITVVSEALEKYYDKNGEYPGCTAMTNSSATIVAGTLVGMDTAALTAPKAITGTNSFGCTSLAAGIGLNDTFAYVGDGSSTCSTGSSCLQYTLQYRQETTGNIISLSSRRTAAIATSGATTLTASGTGFTTINLNWTNVSNAQSYTIQQSTSPSFPTGSSTTVYSNTGNSMIASGLSFNALYYFRVAPISSGGQGLWSSAVSASTWNLAAPANMNAATTSSTSAATSWSTVTHAASYTVQCSTDQSSWAGCSTTTGTNPGWNFTGMPQGTLIYFRAQAVNGSYTGAWSITSATTTIDSPPAYNIASTSNSYQLQGSSSSPCPSGTTQTYKWWQNDQLWQTGTGVSSVMYQISPGQSVTLRSSIACQTSAAISAERASNNSVSLSLQNPTVNVQNANWREIEWTGTCPNGFTSSRFDWVINSSADLQSTNGNSSTPGAYSNQGANWGDGDALVSITCQGPWGTANAYPQIGSNQNGWVPFGPDCVPSINTGICTANWP